MSRANQENKYAYAIQPQKHGKNDLQRKIFAMYGIFLKFTDTSPAHSAAFQASARIVVLDNKQTKQQTATIC